jgi:large conductance mechanosensitive channel
VSLFREFQDPAMKGNAVDLASGAIIGAASSAIITSLVDDVFPPVADPVSDQRDFSNLFVVMDNPNSVAVPRNGGA